MNTHQLQYLKMANKPWMFRLFTLRKLPSLAFWGLKLKELTPTHSHMIIPYSYRSMNPFKSIYFSALFGTAELSTGMLVQLHIQGQGQWSMLVVHAEANFTKKAVGLISFRCNQGQEVAAHIEQIKKDGTGTFVLESIGVDEKGNQIGDFRFTWSLRCK